MTVRRQVFTNDAQDTLSAAINNTVTAVGVNDASEFPSTGDFQVKVNDEIMLVTSRAANTLTVVRGQEGTSGVSHSNGVPISQILTTQSLKSYGRDNVPFFDGSRPPFKLVDATGAILTKSSFTQVNGSTVGTVTDVSTGAIAIVKTSTGALDDLTLLHRAAPSTPYTIVAAVDLLTAIKDTSGEVGVGIGFRNNSGNSVVFSEYKLSGADVKFSINKYSSLTASPTAYGNVGGFFNHRGILWMKINDNGTNFTFSLSNDGETYVQLHQVSRTDFLTPDKIVFGINSMDNQNGVALATLVAWDEGA